MYAAYWNLKGNPFLNVVDPRFLYSVDQYEEAIARFVFLAESGRLGGVLTGPYGVGKSTVLKHVAAAIESRHRLPLIRMDAIPGGQLPMARHILADMKIGGPTSTLADTLMNFGHATEHGNASLTRTLLCIDEAHYLADGDGLYLIHYLSNLRIPDRRTQSETPLFTIILAGSPALLPAIQAHPSLQQRMQIVFRLAPLSREHTAAYIQHHMRAVGGDLWVFDQGALDALHRFSEGLPRKINLLCDTSLMLGFAAKAHQITAPIVRQAAQDTGLNEAPAAATQEVTA
ncbi:MAG TPA: AAA family ATPase [Kiritimatiellia bacterium]|nr:AAA family ATPase [Kiritimatiellia bacterium]HPJ57467.1 AAA family ATPase [Kiritimatiellia bacterium]HPR68571.1 AAA family ATPase [Kiritimatiellia bacterium]HRX06854.1 AAA family ATPase [Kiritimatiellia bacterium]